MTECLFFHWHCIRSSMHTNQNFEIVMSLDEKEIYALAFCLLFHFVRLNILLP